MVKGAPHPETSFAVNRRSGSGEHLANLLTHLLTKELIITRGSAMLIAFSEANSVLTC